MPLGTLERDAPSFFKQGSSALTKLVFFSALALFLMVADTRFRITQQLRSVVSTVLQPVQWLALQPVQMVRDATAYLTELVVRRIVESGSHVELVALRGLYYAMWRQQIGERESGATIEKRHQNAVQRLPDEREQLSMV